MTPRGNLELGRVAVSASGMELSEVVTSRRPRACKGVKGKGFRGNVGENIKRMSGDSVGKVRDNSNAVPSIRCLVGRCVNRRGSMRKSRGRIRM